MSAWRSNSSSAVDVLARGGPRAQRRRTRRVGSSGPAQPTRPPIDPNINASQSVNQRRRTRPARSVQAKRAIPTSRENINTKQNSRDSTPNRSWRTKSPKESATTKSTGSTSSTPKKVHSNRRRNRSARSDSPSVRTREKRHSRQMRRNVANKDIGKLGIIRAKLRHFNDIEPCEEFISRLTELESSDDKIAHLKSLTNELWGPYLAVYQEEMKRVVAQLYSSPDLIVKKICRSFDMGFTGLFETNLREDHLSEISESIIWACAGKDPKTDAQDIQDAIMAVFDAQIKTIQRCIDKYTKISINTPNLDETIRQTFQYYRKETIIGYIMSIFYTYDNNEGTFQTKFMGRILKSCEPEIIGDPRVMNMINHTEWTKEFKPINMLLWPFDKTECPTHKIIACLKIFLKNLNRLNPFQANHSGECVVGSACAAVNNMMSSKEDIEEAEMLTRKTGKKVKPQKTKHDPYITEETKELFCKTIVKEFPEDKVPALFRYIYNLICDKNRDRLTPIVWWCIIRSKEALKTYAQGLVSSLRHGPPSIWKRYYVERARNEFSAMVKQIDNLSVKTTDTGSKNDMFGYIDDFIGNHMAELGTDIPTLKKIYAQAIFDSSLEAFNSEFALIRESEQARAEWKPQKYGDTPPDTRDYRSAAQISSLLGESVKVTGDFAALNTELQKLFDIKNGDGYGSAITVIKHVASGKVIPSDVNSSIAYGMERAMKLEKIRLKFMIEDVQMHYKI